MGIGIGRSACCRSPSNQLDNANEELREVTSSYYDDLAPLGEELPLTPPDPEDIDSWTNQALDQNLEIAAALVGVSPPTYRRQLTQLATW